MFVDRPVIDEIMAITSQHVEAFLHEVALRIHEQRDMLTQLDSAIGDADHGANLDRGFTMVISRLSSATDRSIGGLLKLTGTTLISTVGGAAGPLYGTAFLRAGMAVGTTAELDRNSLVDVLSAALAGVQLRGAAVPGEKTMIDVFVPFISTLRDAVAAGDALLPALRNAVSAAEAGLIAGDGLRATRGRASYLGERSIGLRDPGAASAFLMAQALLAVAERTS